ncbi:MAG: serine/threonine protein kinase, partial [Chloroflexota bacterium]|nr:serine/threonine protein kinase [Chloroflexota bacterium]
MNAEALTGAVLGTSTLQKLLGQGGMGAVYLSQQAQPRRQVAVKVLLSALTLGPGQRTAFLERFRREIDAAASLEHPNIASIYEHNERDGIAFVVMPYAQGGSLREILAREKQLSYAKIADYLDQMAAALDNAHARRVLHGNIKPSNILLTGDNRLLLSDFGLMKVATEEMTPQMRLTGPGAKLIAPAYLAPEQVIGNAVDASADIYALGIVLYQMVTGVTPFEGANTMQIAAKHIQTPPPSPRMQRMDLPIAAEQVILRTLAKRPDERYGRAQELAQAFRIALATAGILSIPNTLDVGTLNPSASGFFKSSNLFAASGQAAPVEQSPAQDGQLNFPSQTDAWGLHAQVHASQPTNSLTSQRAGTTIPTRPRLGRKLGLMGEEATQAQPDQGIDGQSSTATFTFPARASVPTRQLQADSPLPASNTTNATKVLPPLTDSDPGTSSTQNTSALLVPSTDDAGNTNSMMKLTGAVRVVQVPVAGQPGRYMTGLLPVLPTEEETPLPQKSPLR